MNCREHSLSIALGAGYLVCTGLSAWVKHGTWAYDFWMSLSGAFGGNFVLILLARKLWEKDSDPSKPPPEY